MPFHKTRVSRKRAIACVFTINLLALLGCPDPGDIIQDQQPLFVYLTWQGDTSTTMMVNFQTKDSFSLPFVQYRHIPDNGDPPEDFTRIDDGLGLQLNQHEDKRWVHSVEITGLQAGQRYEFRAGLDTGLPSRDYLFRTISDEPDAAIRFINGGDMDLEDTGTDIDDDHTKQLMSQAIKDDPHFALLGGDLVYEGGSEELEEKWDNWFLTWQEIMVTSEDCLVPMVLAVGDHEMDSDDPYDDGPEGVEFFLDFFTQRRVNQKLTYFTQTFGPNLVVYVLDSGNAYSHAEQVQWLQEEMTNHADFPNQFAAYHHPLYPSAKDFDNEWAELGRELWGPVFDEFGLDTAFEHDAHTLKQTFRMRGEIVDPTGTLYLGDGAFGRKTREPDEHEYLEFAEEVKHYWSVSVNELGATYTGVDRKGRVIHQYP